MEKGFIAVIIATICFITGASISASLKMRVHQLEKLVSMLNDTEILIRFRAMRTSEIIAELMHQESYNNFIFLNIMNECVTDDGNIQKSWLIATEKTPFFTESDKRILISVGEQIGSTDIAGQLSMLELNKNLAQRNLSQAEENLRVKGKMFRTVWSLCGIAAGIMII